jgi:hypothetical protein
VDSLVLKITAGAFIPSAATIIFNLLNFAFENYDKHPRPKPSESAFDIAAGCAFSLIGICVTVKNSSVSNRLLVIFACLILFLIAGDMLAPMFLDLNRLLMVVIVNTVSFAALAYAISSAE